MQNHKYAYFFCFCTMVMAVALSILLKPQDTLSAQLPDLQLSSAIPKVAGGWEWIPQYSLDIVNPALNDLLANVYDQLLGRFYQNGQGQVVMLSVSYGHKQIDDGTLHLPEICYPAQGFTLDSSPFKKVITTPYGMLKVKQLAVSKNNRHEFITYWTMLGTYNVSGNWETRLRQINYGLNNQIPDGLVFRISSLGNGDAQNIALHEKFIQALVSSMDEHARWRLSGLRN